LKRLVEKERAKEKEIPGDVVEGGKIQERFFPHREEGFVFNGAEGKDGDAGGPFYGRGGPCGPE